MDINDAALLGDKIGNYYIKKSKAEITQYNAYLFLFDIIKRKEAAYLECDMPEKILGHTMKDELGISVMINNNLDGPRKNFTLAHEVGHLLMHVEDTIKVETNDTISGNKSTEDIEKEANAFAAKLLLPDKVLVNQILSNYSITAISNISKISKEAIYWRIVGYAIDNLYLEYSLALKFADEYKNTHANSEVSNTSIHYLINTNRMRELAFNYR